MGKSRGRRNNRNRNRNSSVSQNQDQREQQQPDANPKTENSDIAKQSVVPVVPGSTRVAVVIKGLEVVAAITGVAAGLLGLTTSYHLLTPIFLFATALSSTSAFCLFWWQNWRNGSRYKTPLITITFLVIVALTSLICWKLNNWLASVNATANKPEALVIKQQGYAFFPVFHQPLLYVYSSSEYMSGTPSQKFIAPVGLAINLEVINNTTTPTKVETYTADLDMGNGSWTRVFSLPTQQPHRLYFDDSLDLKKCFEVEFTPNLFDVVAGQKILLPGESLIGWALFEWPPELKENNKLRNVRIKIKNSQNKESEAVFDLSSSWAEQETGGTGRGISLLNQGDFRPKSPERPREDLSKLPIRPFRNE